MKAWEYFLLGVASDFAASILLGVIGYALTYRAIRPVVRLLKAFAPKEGPRA